MNDIQPLVSVVMPVYNTEKYVGAAIESILEQTFIAFECIIIDDGSTDGSWSIIQQYAKKDPRIIASQNTENRGIGYTRKKLIEQTTTNYIASQDSDDISTPNRLKLCYEFLEKHTDFAVVSGDNPIINEEGKSIGQRIYTNNIADIILKKSPISQGSSLFRKDLFLEVGGYDETLDQAEDYDLRLKFYAAGYKIKNLSSDLYKVRIRAGQTKSAQIKETLRNTVLVQQRAEKQYGIKATTSDKLYRIAEKILIYMPGGFIMWLFKKMSYKKIE